MKGGTPTQEEIESAKVEFLNDGGEIKKLHDEVKIFNDRMLKIRLPETDHSKQRHAVARSGNKAGGIKTARYRQDKSKNRQMDSLKRKQAQEAANKFYEEK